MLKISSKRRRTLAEIKADKQAKEQREQDTQAKLAQFDAMQQRLGEMEAEMQTGQVAASLMSQFVNAGLVRQDEDQSWVVANDGSATSSSSGSLCTAAADMARPGRRDPGHDARCVCEQPRSPLPVQRHSHCPFNRSTYMSPSEIFVTALAASLSMVFASASWMDGWSRWRWRRRVVSERSPWARRGPRRTG